MVQPKDIRRKADAVYTEFLQAWLSNAETAFFPRMIPANRDPARDLPGAIEQVRRLREGSKEVLGYGYQVTWREIKSRSLGRNSFPDRITFDTREDLLRFTGKTREFEVLSSAVDQLRSEFPILVKWSLCNVRSIVAAASDVEGLIAVVRHFVAQPRPDCFARELPVPVDTKFVERNETLLRQWLDLVLPPHAIRADEDHFARRYGLRYAEPAILIRFLDDVVRQRLGFPCSVLSVPLHEIGKWDSPGAKIIVVENKVNLLTLPIMVNSIALGGLGNGVLLLRYLPWLAQSPLTYWGDIDVEGMEILSRVRSMFPHVKSALMDLATLQHLEHLASPGNGRRMVAPRYLNTAEQAAFDWCVARNLRLEQERIPQPEINRALSCVNTDEARS